MWGISFHFFLGSSEVALELDMKNDTQEYGFRKLKVLVTKILSSVSPFSLLFLHVSPISVNTCLLSYFQNQHALYKGHCDSLNVFMFTHSAFFQKCLKSSHLSHGFPEALPRIPGNYQYFLDPESQRLLKAMAIVLQSMWWPYSSNVLWKARKESAWSPVKGSNKSFDVGPFDVVGG